MLVAQLGSWTPAAAGCSPYAGRCESHCVVQPRTDSPPDLACLPPPRQVRVTPTFLIFRNGERVHSHGGVNETNLHRVRSSCCSELPVGRFARRAQRRRGVCQPDLLHAVQHGAAGTLSCRPAPWSPRWPPTCTRSPACPCASSPCLPAVHHQVPAAQRGRLRQLCGARGRRRGEVNPLVSLQQQQQQQPMLPIPESSHAAAHQLCHVRRSPRPSSTTCTASSSPVHTQRRCASRDCPWRATASEPRCRAAWRPPPPPPRPSLAPGPSCIAIL